MNLGHPRRRLLAVFLAGVIAPWLAAPQGTAADFGRLLGTVSDAQGNPLMGASVLIVGPVAKGLDDVGRFAERVITDAHGRFAVERLAPGMYSLRVTSPTRVPGLRNGVGVKAGRTTQESFVLGDIFAPLRFQLPQGSASTWGEDWKWVLRTSAATRPILRFQEVPRSKIQAKTSKPPLAPSQRLIGIIPGGTRGEALAGDPGLGSVLAYLRPLSQDSDLLVAGSMTANGLQASSFATAFRKNLANGDPQLLSVVVHQLSFSQGMPLPPEVGPRLSRAQGVAVGYARTRRLSSSLSLTTGFEVDYLNAARDAVIARPSMKLEYQASLSTTVAFRYGTLRTGGGDTLLDRIGMLNAFPRVTLRGYRPRFENLSHAEVGLHRAVNKASRVEVAAYRDAFQNAAVLGAGGPAVLDGLSGNFLPNPVSEGVIFDGGNYRSSGLRVVYLRTLGTHLETALAYTLGSALTASPAAGDVERDLSGVLRARPSQSFAGKVSARIPISRTQVVTSYEWLQQNRVTSVDPFGQAALQTQPFLGVVIRQPLPTLAFLPAHIEALADFRNLLAQGYVPASRSGEKPLLLTAGYRSFRGGFSVQF